jgi:DNA-binding NtrC family response regulator
MERAALLSHGDEIGPADIVLEDDDLDWHPEGDESPAYEEAKRQAIEHFQRRYVEELMAQVDGNVSAAARKAAMTRAALHRILKRLGLASEDEDVEDEKELDSTRPGS